MSVSVQVLLRLHQGRSTLAIQKNFFTKMIIKHWNRLPKEVMESPSLEVFKRCVDAVLRDLAVLDSWLTRWY